jgi:hypothetical protein
MFRLEQKENVSFSARLVLTADITVGSLDFMAYAL